MIKGKYWLILGSLSYLAILIYSLVFSLEKTSLLINAQVTADWLAASIIYFFIGASIGALIDFWLSKKKLPIFVYLISGLWFIAFLLVIFLNSSKLIISLLYPLVYGIFLTGSFYTIFPDIIKDFYFAQVIFNVIFVSLFGFWLFFELKNINKNLRNIFLVTIFLILILGTLKSIFIFIM